MIVVNYPDSICNPGSIPLSVEILNQGGTAVPGGTATISWTETGSQVWQTENVSSLINPGGVSWTFNTLADLSSCGPNTFQVAISSPLDQNSSNDTVQFTIFSTCVINPNSVLGDTICATQNQQLEVDFIFSHFNPAILTWFRSDDGGNTWTDLNTQSSVVNFSNPQNGTIALAIFDGGGICPNDTVKMVLFQQQNFFFSPNQNELSPCSNEAEEDLIIVHGNNMNDNIIFSTNSNGIITDPFDDTTTLVFDQSDYANNNLWVYAQTINPSQCPFEDSIQIQWQQAPNGVITSNAPFCAGDTAVFQGAGGLVYSWYQDPNDLSSGVTTTGSFEYVVSNDDTLATFIIGFNGCADTVITFNTVNESPEIQTFNDTVVCPGDNIQLIASDALGGATNSYSWSWSPAFGLDNASIQNPNAFIKDDISFIVEAVNQFGCSDSDTINILFPPGFNYDHFPDTAICPGTTITLETNTTGGSVNWTPNQWISNPSDPNPAVTPASSLFYVVEVDSGACSFTDSIKVVVDSLLAEIVCDSTFCDEEEFFTSINGTSVNSYFWMVDGNYQSNTTTMSHMPTGVDSMLIQCEMVTYSGCNFMLSRTVTKGSEIDCSGELNNAFSPNGDGINDTWIINILDGNTPNQVEIFTRYGDKLVSFENYNNIDIVWDGSNSSGKKMPSGTYYYVIESEGQKIAGWVNISE